MRRIASESISPVVGVYSQELVRALSAAHPEQAFQFVLTALYRYFRSFAERLPPNCRRALLQEPWLSPLA
jgi:hypothetical protein